MKLENYHLAHTAAYNCGRAESTKDAKIRGWLRDEKWDICIIARYLPKAVLSVTKRNMVTLQRRNLGANALTHDHKLSAPGARCKDSSCLRGVCQEEWTVTAMLSSCQTRMPSSWSGENIRGSKLRGDLQNNWTRLSKCQIMKDNGKLRSCPSLEKTKNSGWLNATCQGPGPAKGHWRGNLESLKYRLVDLLIISVIIFWLGSLLFAHMRC